MAKTSRQVESSKSNPGAVEDRRAGAVDLETCALALAAGVMACAGLLRLSASAAVGKRGPLSWMEAVFTATSAVTLTGLSIRDTATQFSPFGQMVIAVFIQMSGVAFLSIGTWVVLGGPRRGIGRIVRSVVVTTLTIELAGACVMLPLWQGDLTAGQRVGLSLFHAVMAFCNAGFTTLDAGLTDYRYSGLLHGVLGPLIVLGGLGVPVLLEIFAFGRGREKRWRLSRRTRVVLATSAGLYLLGVVVMLAAQLAPYASEYYQLNVVAHRQTPPEMSAQRVGMMLADASFLSVTSRTCGLSAVSIDQVGLTGQAALLGLMFVGGSVGGVAGGIKTTAAALLLAAVVATLRGRREVRLGGLRVEESAVRGALAVTGVMALVVIVGTLLLTLFEPSPFIKDLFEIVSAASNTGLSLGVAGLATSFGKCVIIAAMFAGRLLPMGLAGLLVGGVEDGEAGGDSRG